MTFQELTSRLEIGTKIVLKDQNTSDIMRNLYVVKRVLDQPDEPFSLASEVWKISAWKDKTLIIECTND